MPAVIDGTGTSTFPAVDGVTMLEGSTAMPRMVLSTAQNTTSGTAIDFTGIPSWAKRITVMLNGVSTNGVSNIMVQLGAGSVKTTGYTTARSYVTASNSNAATETNGFQFWSVNGAAQVINAQLIFTCMDQANGVWIGQGQSTSGGSYTIAVNGIVSLAGVLDRVRITSVTPDTFDAGSVNIMYEG